jgi:hypothetical protein
MSSHRGTGLSTAGWSRMIVLSEFVGALHGARRR